MEFVTSPPPVDQREIYTEKAKQAYADSLRGKPDKKSLLSVGPSHVAEIEAVFDALHIPRPQFEAQERVLDLGCGADTSQDHRAPLFPRYLASKGVQVVGIDMAANDPRIDDAYTHIIHFLNPDTSISHVLQDHGITGSFDFIYSAMTFDPDNISPAFTHTTSNPEQDARQVKNLLILEATTLLNPNGYLFFNHKTPELWQKQGFSLQKIT